MCIGNGVPKLTLNAPNQLDQLLTPYPAITVLLSNMTIYIKPVV